MTDFGSAGKMLKNEDDSVNSDKLKSLVEEKLRKHGYSSREEYRKNVVPLVPDAVRHTAAYLKLFKNPDTVLQLRPMLVTWWG